MLRSMLLLPALLLIAWAPPWAEAGRDLFSWRDAEGVVHYADRPGMPDAVRIDRHGHTMSIVDTAPAREHTRENAMRPVIERELRWQEAGHRRDRKAALAESARAERSCADLRAQITDAERARKLARVRDLEEKFYAACR